MKLVLVGCPYTCMRALEESLRGRCPDLRVVNTVDIAALTYNGFSLAGDEGTTRFDDVACAYIRYPYDLIPPHSGTFVLREKTELLKTVSLMLEDKAVNPIVSAWAARNRLYSLREAKACGLNVPESFLTTPGVLPPRETTSGQFFIKAAGNCFVSEGEDQVPSLLKPFLRFDEDDGDFAWYLPAQVHDETGLKSYVDAAGIAFTQTPLLNQAEYRAYVIGEQVLAYKRKDSNDPDRSAATYGPTSERLDEDTQKAIRGCATRLGLRFLCLDLIRCDAKDIVIDVNPFGSLPDYDFLPEPTDALADLIIGISNEGGALLSEAE